MNSEQKLSTHFYWLITFHSKVKQPARRSKWHYLHEKFKIREALITLNNQEELDLCLKLEWHAISLTNKATKEDEERKQNLGDIFSTLLFAQFIDAAA